MPSCLLQSHDPSDSLHADHRVLERAEKLNVWPYTWHKLRPMPFKRLSTPLTPAKSKCYLKGCDVESLGICLVWGWEPSEWRCISLLTPRLGQGHQDMCLPGRLGKCSPLLPQPTLFQWHWPDSPAWLEHVLQAHSSQGWSNWGGANHVPLIFNVSSSLFKNVPAFQRITAPHRFQEGLDSAG